MLKVNLPTAVFGELIPGWPNNNMRFFRHIRQSAREGCKKDFTTEKTQQAPVG